MWNEFNIKTFPAETVVYRDGVYCPELSTLDNAPINKKYKLPVHIIYVGEIAGENNLDVQVGAENQKIIVSVNVKIKKPAFLNFFIKNAGENSEIQCNIMMDNYAEINLNCVAEHLYKNTGIFVKNKVICRKNSDSKLSGTAIIKPDTPECKSNMEFVAMVEDGARVEFIPAQKISAEPIAADHSASIFKPTDAQIFYLRQAGLSGAEVDIAMKEAFLNS